MSDRDPPDGYTGLWIFDNGEGHRREIEYVDGQRTGSFRVLLPNGAAHREGRLINGLYHGDLIS